MKLRGRGDSCNKIAKVWLTTNISYLLNFSNDPLNLHRVLFVYQTITTVQKN